MRHETVLSLWHAPRRRVVEMPNTADWCSCGCLLVRMIVIRVHASIRPVRLCGINFHDRKQWQAKITYVPEHAIQRGLIDERASEDGCSVALMAEPQARKPLGPPGIQMSLEANLVPSRLVLVLRRSVWCTHAAPRACSAGGSRSPSLAAFLA